MSWRSRLSASEPAARGPATRGPACRPCLFSLGLLLTACSGNAFLIGESNTDGSDFAGARVPRPEPEDNCPDPAELRLLDNACWPTRHVGRWHGFATTSPQYHHRLALPFEYPSGGLLLQIDEQGLATLTFSASPLQRAARPNDAGQDFDAGVADAAADASAGVDGGLAGDAGAAGGLDAGAESAPEDAGARLDAGVAGSRPALGLALDFPYRLRELKMRGAPIGQRSADPRVDFSLLIAEPWSDVCTASLAQDPELAPCVCGADACGPDPELLTVTLSLSADGQALRGNAQSEAPEGVLAAGWEFVRE
jgi:hypothetical protein